MLAVAGRQCGPLVSVCSVAACHPSAARHQEPPSHLGELPAPQPSQDTQCTPHYARRLRLFRHPLQLASGHVTQAQPIRGLDSVGGGALREAGRALLLQPRERLGAGFAARRSGGAGSCAGRALAGNGSSWA